MRRSRQGMSLTETIVGVGIFSVVIALVMAAMVTSFQTWNQTASQSATEEVLFKAHNLLFRDLTNTAPDQGRDITRAQYDLRVSRQRRSVVPLFYRPGYGRTSLRRRKRLRRTWCAGLAAEHPLLCRCSRRSRRSGRSILHGGRWYRRVRGSLPPQGSNTKSDRPHRRSRHRQ